MVEMRRDVQLSLYLCDISIYFLGDFPYHDKNKEIKVPNKFQIIIYYGICNNTINLVFFFFLFYLLFILLSIIIYYDGQYYNILCVVE